MYRPSPASAEILIGEAIQEAALYLFHLCELWDDGSENAFVFSVERLHRRALVYVVMEAVVLLYRAGWPVRYSPGDWEGREPGPHGGGDKPDGER
jgi:hypothetical protein